MWHLPFSRLLAAAVNSSFISPGMRSAIAPMSHVPLMSCFLTRLRLSSVVASTCYCQEECLDHADSQLFHAQATRGHSASVMYIRVMHVNVIGWCHSFLTSLGVASLFAFAYAYAMAPKKQPQEKKEPSEDAAEKTAAKKPKLSGKDGQEVPSVRSPSPPPPLSEPRVPRLEDRPDRPLLPSDESQEPAIPVLTNIMDWAGALVLKAAQDRGLGKGLDNLESFPPLEWNQAPTSATSGTTYKEVWIPDHCNESMRGEGLYEAGASLWWLEPVPDAGDISWASVALAAKVLRPTETKAGHTRILWPCVMYAGCRLGALSPDGFPKRLQLLHGHVLIFGWWLAVYKALAASDEKTLGMLIESALCVTIQLRALEKPADFAVASIDAASLNHELKVMNEPFHAFAYKISILLESLSKADRSSQQKSIAALAKMHKDKLRFEGKVLNKTMLGAAIAIANAFPAQEVGAKLLSLLFHWHSSALSQYGRLYKIVNTFSGFMKDTEQSDGLLQAWFRKSPQSSVTYPTLSELPGR